MKRSLWSALAISTVVGLAACGGATEDDAGMAEDTVMPAPAPVPPPVTADTAMSMDTTVTDTM